MTAVRALTPRGVLFGPDAPFRIAAGCTALRAWDVRCCPLTLRQMNRLMSALPDVAMMSSGKPLFVLGERSFTLFEGDEVPPRCMSFRLRMEALVRHHFARCIIACYHQLILLPYRYT